MCLRVWVLVTCCRANSIITVWKYELFTLNVERFRQIKHLEISAVNMVISRNFCQNSARVNFCIFHIVNEISLSSPLGKKYKNRLPRGKLDDNDALCGNYNDLLSWLKKFRVITVNSKHSVNISWFFCHSDFTWNQCWRI